MKKILRVHMNYKAPGFFVFPEFVINAILYCRSQPDYCPIPTIHFGRNTMKGKNSYFEAKYGRNMFEYFFYLKQKNSPWDRLSSRRINKPAKFWKNIHNSVGIQCYPHGKYEYLREYYDQPRSPEAQQWYSHNRQLAHQVIHEHIGIKQEVLDRVEHKWNHCFQPDDYVIGVHARGTDKRNGTGGRIVLPEEYFPYIDKLVAEHDAKIFFATDDPSFCEQVQQRYGERLFVNPALRHEEAIHNVDHGSPYQKGLEVLVDCLMLSRCDFLLKCSSAVSEFAIFFNNALDPNSLDLQYDCSEFL